MHRPFGVADISTYKPREWRGSWRTTQSRNSNPSQAGGITISRNLPELAFQRSIYGEKVNPPVYEISPISFKQRKARNIPRKKVCDVCCWRCKHPRPRVEISPALTTIKETNTWQRGREMIHFVFITRVFRVLDTIRLARGSINSVMCLFFVSQSSLVWVWVGINSSRTLKDTALSVSCPWCWSSKLHYDIMMLWENGHSYTEANKSN